MFVIVLCRANVGSFEWFGRLVEFCVIRVVLKVGLCESSILKLYSRFYL
jgi:hypothetical protein